MRSIERAEAQAIRMDRSAPGGTLGERIVAKARVASAIHMAQSAVSLAQSAEHGAQSARLVHIGARSPTDSVRASAKGVYQ